MLLPAGERRLYEHADARAHGQEGHGRRGPLSCGAAKALEGTPGVTPGGNPGVTGMTSRPADSEEPSTPPMTVLVTGGTGFLGASLTRRLLVRRCAGTRAGAITGQGGAAGRTWARKSW